MLSHFVDTMTIVGTLLAIYQIANGVLYPGRIVFVEHATVDLFAAIVKRFPEIKIKYQNRPISSNLVLLVGSVVNKGRIDLEPKEGEGKLRIKVPNGFRWVAARAIRKSPGLKASIMINKSDLAFDFKLFRREEIIQFEAICEVDLDYSPSLMLSALMSFHHRIPNTKVVDRMKSFHRYLGEGLGSRLGFRHTLFLVMLASMLLFTVGTYFWVNDYLVYKYDVPGRPPVLVRAAPAQHGGIGVTSIHGSYHRKVSLDDFRAHAMPVIGKESFLYHLLYWYDRFEYLFILIAVEAGIQGFMLSRYSRLVKSIESKTEEILDSRMGAGVPSPAD